MKSPRHFALLLMIATGFSMMGSHGSAAAPDQLKLQCASSELGQMTIELSNPTKQTLDCDHYDILVSRLDHQMNHLETQKISARQGSAYQARNCGNGEGIELNLPPVTPDWSTSAGKCWSAAPYAGAWFTFSHRTGQVLTKEGDLTHAVVLTTEGLNPSATYKAVRRGPFYHQVPFVNGRECKETSNTIEPARLPECQLVLE